MILAISDRRALAAIDFVHAITGARVGEPLRVAAPGVVLARNRSGLHVVREADGFAAYTARFDAPPAAAARSFDFTVHDPRHRFLDRAFTLALPREHAPASSADSVLRPLVVRLYPSAAAATVATWALARVRVQTPGARRGLANVLVRLAPQPAGLAPQLATTDASGEALLAVAGAAPVMPAAGGGNGGILVTDFDASLRLVLDPRAVRVEGAPLPAPDPEAIAARADEPGVRSVDAAPVSLAAGRTRRVVVEVPWPQ